MQLDTKTILFLVLIVLVAALLVWVIVLTFKYRKVYRAYDFFMRGRDASNLEELIKNEYLDIEALKEEDKANKEAIKVLNRIHKASFQKSGAVHYNAFKGMGGNLSFALALLDYNNSGYIINSVHSREGCYVYTKNVEKGKTDILLGAEEQAALEQALGYTDGE